MNKVVNTKEESSGHLFLNNPLQGLDKLALSSKKYDPLVQKVGFELALLKDEYDANLTENFSSFFQSTSSLLQLQNNGVFIDAIAIDDTEKLLTDLENLGLQNGSSFGAVVSGWLPVALIEDLVGLESLNFARPAYKPIYNIGATTSQADISMRADIARTTFGLDGSGITVGVLSDSYNFLGGAATDIASGDLPGSGNPFGYITPVNVLEDDGQSDEGRGMLQLIHDVAPGASLAFHTANGGLANFAQGIIDLANTGCDIIVDDITYLAQPFFQEGIVAQAANAVVSAGIPFFSSAGNQARQSYESLFDPAGLINIGGDDYLIHDFDPSSGVDILQHFVLNQGETTLLSFQWDQPHASSGGASCVNDLDIFLVNSAGSIVTGSINRNIGGDPVEVLGFQNTGATDVFSLLIGQWLPGGGSQPGLIKYVDFRKGTDDAEYHTFSSTIFGHHNALGASSVGAAFYGQTPEFGSDPPLLESFSSVGGTPILFDTAGNALTNPFVPEQPRIVAPDGTNTTFFGGSDVEGDGFPNFFGTSAAAPHAAAIAALMLEAVPGTAPFTLYDALETTAVDMRITGPDFYSGFGLIQADAAIQELVSSQTPTITIDVSPTSVNEDGTTNLIYTFSRSTPTTNALTVNFTIGGTATRPGLTDSDYTVNGGTLSGSNGSITFVAGSSTATLTVNPSTDSTVEPDEIVILNLASGTGYDIGNPSVATGTIINDDQQAQTGSISGMKWNDLDADGVKDAGELGLQGWTIYLDDNQNGQLDAGETYTTTDVDGNYSFTNLLPDTYIVAEELESGWQQTFPGTGGGGTGLSESIAPIDPLVEELTSNLEDNEIDKTSFAISQSQLEEQLGINFLDQPLEVRTGAFLIATGSSPDKVRPFGTDNVNAADTTNADQIGSSSGLNLTGNGIIVGIWDGGKVRNSHQEFNGVPIVFGDGATDFSNHATHVAGTIAAQGVNPSARGMTSQVEIRSYDYFNDYAEMAPDVSLIDLSNHSYGQKPGWNVIRLNDGSLADVWWADRSNYAVEDPYYGKYDTGTDVGQGARELDQFLYNNPYYLSVWSAGNERNNQFTNVRGNNTYITYLSDPAAVGLGTTPGYYWVPTNLLAAPPGDGNGGTGYDSLAGNKTAKNGLVVGAINDITADPYNNSHVSMSSFSSWGPTDDGRIKPDVVGNGVDLNSSIATSDNAYDIYSGTSMAAPNVTGTTALLYEHYDNLFGAKPHSATMKGTLIHTAFDAGNIGPDYVYGWGVVDGVAAANFLTEADNIGSAHLFQEETYNGSEWTFTIASDGIEPLKASIVWTDPAGTAHPSGLDITTPVLVNDLDLWITGPEGTFLPWTLDPANPSAAAVRTSANHLDNVEQVLIDTPIAGNYTIHVDRTGNSFNQDFSLFVSGIGSSTTPIPGTHTVTLAEGQDVTGIDFGNKQITPPTPIITVTVSPTSVNEDGTENLIYTFTRTDATTNPLTVNFTTGGTATQPGSTDSDYTVSGGTLSGNNGTITFEAGSSTATLTVNPTDDSTFEPDETVIVNLASGTGYDIGTPSAATGTILNDDPQTSNQFQPDFNLDGKRDFVWRNEATGRNVVWYMDGATLIDTDELLSVNDPNWQIVGAGDPNGDQNTDIYWRNEATGRNVVWYMNGATRIDYDELSSVNDPNWQIVGIGDADGDSLVDDIYWRNQATGRDVVWFMDGASRTDYNDISQVSNTDWQIVSVGDIDGDSLVDDLLWRNQVTGRNVEWFMECENCSSTAELLEVTNMDWQIVGTGDATGDQKTDIFWRNQVDGRNVCWAMDGTNITSVDEFPQVTNTDWQIVI